MLVEVILNELIEETFNLSLWKMTGSQNLVSEKIHCKHCI